jgi:hypothetical protein
MSSSRKRKATEEAKNDEEYEVKVEDIDESNDIADDDMGVETKVSAKPTGKIISILAKKYAERDWAGELTEDNPNRAVALAYKHRYLPHMGDTYISVEKPNEKPKANAKKQYKAGTVFINMRFKVTPNDMVAEFVVPISRVCNWKGGASLQTGSYFRNERNKGKNPNYLADSVDKAKKTIALSAVAWQRVVTNKDGTQTIHKCRVNKQGLNADFMDAIASLNKMARMVFVLMIKEDRSLMPKFLIEAENKYFEQKAASLQATYDALVTREKADYESKTIDAVEYKKRVAALRSKYFISRTSTVDIARLKAATSNDDVVDAMMKTTHFVDKLKVDANNIPYMAFDMDVTRYTNELERKGWDDDKKCIIDEFAPKFPDALCRAVFIGSKGEKTINHHTFTNLADWTGKDKKKDLNKELTDQERETQGIADWNRQIPALSLVGLKLITKIFTTSPQATAGCGAKFRDVIFLAHPTAQDFIDAKSQGSTGFKPRDEDKVEVGGAEPYAPSPYDEPVDQYDPAEIEAETAESIRKAKQKAAQAAADAKGPSTAAPTTAVHTAAAEESDDAAMLAAEANATKV